MAAQQDVSTATPWFGLAKTDSRPSAELRAETREHLYATVKLACEANPQDLDLNLRYANLLLGRGDLMAAQDAYVRVLDIDDGHIVALFQLATICRHGGFYVEAIDLVRHAHRVHGDHPDVIAALTTLAIDVGDAYGAKQLLVHLTRAQRSHPERLELIRRLATLRCSARSPHQLAA